jgi:hypothetical protein
MVFPQSQSRLPGCLVYIAGIVQQYFHIPVTPVSSIAASALSISKFAQPLTFWQSPAAPGSGPPLWSDSRQPHRPELYSGPNSARPITNTFILSGFAFILSF